MQVLRDKAFWEKTDIVVRVDNARVVHRLCFVCVCVGVFVRRLFARMNSLAFSASHAPRNNLPECRNSLIPGQESNSPPSLCAASVALYCCANRL